LKQSNDRTCASSFTEDKLSFVDTGKKNFHCGGE